MQRVAIARELGSTVIYATPDPLDVLSLAEKVVVLDEGRVKQYGETLDFYRNPLDSFIGKYFGYPEMNFIEGRLSARDSKITFQFEGNELDVTPMRTALEGLLESSVIVGFRPEDIYSENSPRNAQDFTVEGTLLLGEVIGSDTILHLECAAVKMKVFVPEILHAKPGQRLPLHFGLRDCHFFDSADSKLICRG
ncbi:MAG: TOBE domain-containing protein [Deltaproteobacteria bacterium]|nr:TOBE domain-containing protein [Deltaproteobacteria bacterium]